MFKISPFFPLLSSKLFFLENFGYKFQYLVKHFSQDIFKIESCRFEQFKFSFQFYHNFKNFEYFLLQIWNFLTLIHLKNDRRELFQFKSFPIQQDLTRNLFRLFFCLVKNFCECFSANFKLIFIDVEWLLGRLLMMVRKSWFPFVDSFAAKQSQSKSQIVKTNFQLHFNLKEWW